MLALGACVSDDDGMINPDAGPDTGTEDGGPMDDGAMMDDTGIDTGPMTDGGTDAALPTAVSPLHGDFLGWNDYVRNDDETSGDPLGASITACDPMTDALRGPHACFHAGELRAFALPFADCVGVTISDALNAFEWICDESDGVRAVSIGLAEGMYLSDLIDATPAWRENSVTATRGAESTTSDSTVWWDNPVEAAPSGGALDTESTIYVVAADLNASFTIGAPRVGLVIAEGATLTGSGFAVTGNQPFLWAEGTFTGGGLQLLQNFSQARNVVTTSTSGEGVDMQGAYAVLVDITASGASTAVRVMNDADYAIGRNIEAFDSTNGLLIGTNIGASFDTVHVHDNTGFALWIAQGMGTRYEHIRADNNRFGIYCNSTAGIESIWMNDVTVVSNQVGIQFSTGIRNSVFANIIASNNRGFGIETSQTPSGRQPTRNNVLLNVFAINNGINLGESGIGIGEGFVLINASSFNNTRHGVSVGVSGATAMNLALLNNSGTGLNNDQAVDVRYHNVSSTDNGRIGGSTDGDVVIGSNSNDIAFSGGYRVTDLNDDAGCLVFSGQPRTGVAFTAGMCMTIAPSTASISEGSALLNPVGAVTTGDLVNMSEDSLGRAPFDDITDWYDFAFPWRTWGRLGNIDPSMHRGACESGDVCQIWDGNLRTDFDGFINFLPAPVDGDDAFVHEWSVVDEDECNRIRGGVWTGSTCTTAMLRNAYEPVTDGIGNDNGICESDETCVRTPNFGAYQGHGAFESAGSIGAGGTVENVTLLRYETIGYDSE